LTHMEIEYRRRRGAELIINFVMYKFSNYKLCYVLTLLRINSASINYVTYKFCDV
jgi:hypothetical protein